MTVRTPLCDLLGIEHPIVGFTPSEHVAAAISRAGGLGVLGCVRFNDPAELDAVLDWMDASTDGRPYGIDVVMPARVPAEGTARDLDQLIPPGHKEFVEQTLLKLGVPPLPADDTDGAATPDGVLGWLHSVARQHVEVALAHPARLIANALGPPPPDVIEHAHDAGMLVAALAGKAEHARRQVASGVDIVVAQGYEAGGHTGEIGSMVLVPEIVDAVSVPVLAAGGIGCGRQIAAALALGAVGAWMGSAWLTTEEYAVGTPALRTALLNATSSDTVRSRVYSGKPARLLKNKWTQAWTEPGAPDPLPMPLQNVLVAQAHRRLMEAGDPGVIPMPAGQIVGRLNEVRPVAEVMAGLVREADETLARLGSLSK
jgi:NAD(P)H-dependent flavin oxidoreductase YrpB (nitropropane dioxygenase family)